ncbi:helix-turn-helix domain-containing protein [Streptomyces sp. NRRL B-1677]|uniref:helix-turn-helix domain-containing protein n=1 Tax=Streptomyces sp. NRRL B-1677 TaxID=2682966 RepID=UPI001892B856|nr:helix-turn-helix transcriptional regulator [Streptomyces sp. NRRL B-1677]MBF6044381.1 helix-turn-helix domain-containing protein [Streptomyces sp. NRRL B-1677]
MARRTIVTARQERLGAELRKLRERAGVSARDAATAVGRDQAWLSHMEAGNAALGAERARALAARYGVQDAALVKAVVERADERTRGWWEKFRGRMPKSALDLAELEWHASALRSVQVVNVPGLLQTEDYMRALFSYVASDLELCDLDTVVEFRLQRRQVLERKDPPTLLVIVHEAALRMRVGDRKVARGQLDYLLAAFDRPSITIQVLPFEVEGFAGMGYSMLYVADRVAAFDTVQVDQMHGNLFLREEDQLVKYRNRWDKLDGVALGSSESRDFIHRIAREL